MKETRSPLKDKPLRNPGQSVREQRADLMFDKLLSPMLIALMLVLWAVMDWLRYFFPRPPQPWITSVVAALAIIYVVWQFRRHVPKLRMLKLAEEGEKAVGQLLERLRASGYAVFHDLIGTDFNVDHVIIGSAGVFTIETKTWNKPRQGNPRITFDGETLLMAGREPDRNPVIQAKAQASWLQRLLAESTGKTLPVRPVILFPGWYIEDSRASRKDLWVLEPKALSAFLAQEKAQLSPEDVALAAFHLSRFIRAQERAFEAQR
ncbi:MAG TPA: nuclease-related domain-containing protein [Rhodocyclaceae bacterium]|nr:nuclease-related domain-containing protein [Rhodocyclaceae bacterium]